VYYYVDKGKNRKRQISESSCPPDAQTKKNEKKILKLTVHTAQVMFSEGLTGP